MAPRIDFATRPANPVLQFLYLIAGTVLLIGAVVMGAVILSFVIGIALIVGIVVWVRIWWLARKFRRAASRQPGTGPRAGRPAEGGVEITGVEYHVVREEARRDDD